MVELLEKNINNIKLPKGEYLDTYFYVDRKGGEIHYNGLTNKVDNSGLPHRDFYLLILLSHAIEFFKLKLNNNLVYLHFIKNEHEFDHLIELEPHDIDTITIFDESSDNIIDSFLNNIKNSNLFFLDVTHLSQFIAGQHHLTFNTIKLLDELLSENNLTRIYKHYNNFYFLNYEL